MVKQANGRYFISLLNDHVIKCTRPPYRSAKKKIQMEQHRTRVKCSKWTFFTKCNSSWGGEKCTSNDRQHNAIITVRCVYNKSFVPDQKSYATSSLSKVDKDTFSQFLSTVNIF